MENVLHLDPEVPIADIEVSETKESVDVVPKMAESITECGLLHPITITPKIDPANESDTDKYILVAGKKRLQAAKNNLWATIPAFIVTGDAAHLASIAAQENLVRHKLTCLDKDLLLLQWQTAYEKKHPETKKGGDQTQKEQSGNLSFCQYASERTPYNLRTIQRSIWIAKGLDPEAIETLKLAASSSHKPAKLADHQASLERLVREFKHNTKLQKPAILKAHGNPKKLPWAIEELQREELKQQTCNWTNENITLHAMDFRKAGKEVVPDNEVSLVVTDPPWGSQYLYLAEPLGEFVDRVLKPGGAVVMMLGQATQLPFLEQVRKRLTDDKYHWWEFAYLYKDEVSAIVQHVNVATKWKPIWVAFKAGGTKHQVIPDLIKETGGIIEGGGKDKTYHEWGQSVDGFEKLINYLTKPGDLVVDPFVGGGATAVAAFRTARKFIGIDINEDNIKMTRLHLQDEEEKAKGI